MSSPDFLQVLGHRIFHLYKTDHCSVKETFDLAQLGFNPEIFIKQLYDENVRAFTDRYENRHKEDIYSFCFLDKNFSVDEIDFTDNEQKLLNMLVFFVYQCYEGECYKSPMFRFLKTLKTTLEAKGFKANLDKYGEVE